MSEISRSNENETSGISVSQEQLWTVGGASVLLIGSLGPWINAGFFSVSGSAGDGVIFAGVAVAIAVVVGFLGKGGKWAIAGAVLAVLSAVYAVSRIMEIKELNDGFIIASPGWGLFAMIIGGAAAAFGCLKSRLPPPPAEPSPESYEVF